ncbi:MAG: hypothetical protein Tsb007_39650 [Rhizobacter sp.]
MESERLQQRQNQVVADLCRLVQRMSTLSYGELNLSWAAHSDSWWLRLGLAPRRQGLLFDPLARSRSRPGSMVEEAKLLWRDIEASPMRALLAARGLMKWATFAAAPSPLDPQHELAYRRSKQQWQLESECGQLTLAFADCPRYIADPLPVEICGVIETMSMRVITLRQPKFINDDDARTGANLPSRLRVVPPATGPRSERSIPWHAVQEARPETLLALTVTLHRCLVSKRVIGASVTPIDATW